VRIVAAQGQGQGQGQGHDKPCLSKPNKIWDGVFCDLDRKQSPCKLKVAFDESGLERLENEQRVFALIGRRDGALERHRYLVNWLLPSSQLLSQESVFFLDDSGDRISAPAPALALATAASPLLGMGMGMGMMRGLVLESGGCNLREFIENADRSSHSSSSSSHSPSSAVPVTQRVQILGEIVEAVSFLHKMGIVHFDLKPENVVSFISGGPSQRMRWKLIDFDSSHDIHPSSSAFGSLSSSGSAPRAVLSCETLGSSESAASTVWLTQEYAAPEVMKMIDQWMTLPAAAPVPPLTSPASSFLTPAAAPPLPPLAIDASMDIWSLGMIGFFILTNRSFWAASVSSSSSSAGKGFKSSLVSSVSQEHIASVLSGLTLIEHKELSFLESCLQVDAGKRWSASGLLKKSLFTTSSSTVAANDLRASKEELRLVIADLWAARTLASSSSSSSSLSSEEGMALQLEEFGQWLVPKLEQLLTMTTAEIAELVKSKPSEQRCVGGK
jgi:serine/threonine protein kinase